MSGSSRSDLHILVRTCTVPDYQPIYSGPLFVVFAKNGSNDADELIYFLKNEEIRDGFKAKGLQKAKKAFSLMSLPEKDRIAYSRYQDDLRYQSSLIESNYGLGRLEGREEGKLEVARRLIAKGMNFEEAAEVAGVRIEILKSS